MDGIYRQGELTELAKKLFEEERSVKRLDGWFLALETAMHLDNSGKSKEVAKAESLKEIVAALPLSISDFAVFAGTQRDSFARSYALIHPSFRVEEFNGYCDPTAVFDDIEPNDEFTSERIARVRAYMEQTDYVRQLTAVYDQYAADTREVAYFVEQVTGHLIPDFRYVLKHGVRAMIDDAKEKEGTGYQAMSIALESVLLLAARYRKIAIEKMAAADSHRRKQLQQMADTLQKVPENGADNLYEAIQMFLLLWQVMCLEQAPNPMHFQLAMQTGFLSRTGEIYHGRKRRSCSSIFWCFSMLQTAAGLYRRILLSAAVTLMAAT